MAGLASSPILGRATLLLALATVLPAVVSSGLALEPERPNVLIVTVDTLRADRLSAYGYERPTSPNLDELIGQGARFTSARTVEPLTSPALCSMITARYPHEHGSTRNGLRMRAGLDSLPKKLRAEGYLTAAFVGNWTLRDKLSRMGEHFEDYNELFTRKRYFGLVKGESTAKDMTERGLEWLEDYRGSGRDTPFLLWLHYADPHSPYELHKEFVPGLGIEKRSKTPPVDRYDTEVAYTDLWIGNLLKGLERLGLRDDTLIVFTSDHGESLGEHNYWGHGRHLFEPTLHLPMSVTWPGRIEPRTVEAPALIVDVPTTILGLLGLDSPAEFAGFDWSGVLLAGDRPPSNRVTYHQAHKGAVISNHDSEMARQAGLLALAVIDNGKKTVYRLAKSQHWKFDLAADPRELRNLMEADAALVAELENWMEVVNAGLNKLDEAPPPPLDADTVEQLRALGYAD